MSTFNFTINIKIRLVASVVLWVVAGKSSKTSLSLFPPEHPRCLGGNNSHKENVNIRVVYWEKFIDIDSSAREIDYIKTPNILPLPQW